MRFEAGGLSVRPIAGARAVLFGMDATEEARRELLGFALGKRDGNEVRWMRGFKFFEEVVTSPQPGERRSTEEHPIQSFQWGDYSASPGVHTDYVVKAVYGTPTNLRYGPEIDVPVTPRAERGTDHDVLFNRGAIPSQAFADRFGNSGPTEAEQNDPGNAKVQWLSRGLLEAALGFIAEANGARFELLVGAYEFVYPPVIEALAAAAGTGARVRISYDGGDRKRDGSITPSHISPANAAAITAAGLDTAANVSLHPRTRYSSIPHNKFIVLKEGGHAVAVWTGSTNFTPSGFLGQSNVGHLIRDPALATRYEAYWQELALDRETRGFKQWITESYPDPPDDLPAGITPVFSPRRKGMLEWYGRALGAAQQSAMFTAAFGVARELAPIFGADADHLRFLLMERREGRDDVRAHLEADRDVVVALGARLNSQTIGLELDGHRLDEWFREEEHFRSRGHIFYVHTKIMGLDLLSDDPRLFTGSANFSRSSVGSNDENMLLMRGPAFRPQAELYATEFMRLFNHLYFRTIAVQNARARRGSSSRAAFLAPDDSWVRWHFEPWTYRGKKRLLFR